MKIRTLGIWAASAAAVAALGLFAAACGDDDSSGGSSGGGGGTGSDASYVASVCKAELKLQDAVTNASKDPSKITDANAALDLFTKPLDQFVKDMKAANPPKDVKSYHDQMVKSFEDATAKLKANKDVSALGDINSPEPPQDIKDRLSKAAASNDDCKKAGFDFS